MKKLISTIFTIALLAACNPVLTIAQSVTLTPSSTSLAVSTTGITYDFCEVYQLVASPAPNCYGGLQVFDNACKSYTQVIDGNLYMKVTKGSGNLFMIPFNTATTTANAFGNNLFANGLTQNILIIYYKTGYVWVYTFQGAFNAPVSTYTPPSCPNKPPSAFLWYYSDSHLMVAGASNERDNCPLSAVISKNGTAITVANVTALCGATASLLTQNNNTMIFNVSEGGTYVATVTTSGGSGTSTSVIVPVTSLSKKGKK